MKEYLDLERQTEQAVKQTAERISFSEIRQTQILDDIHTEIQNRSGNMTKKSGRKILAAAAIMAVLAVGTAVGAGRIAYLGSHTRVDQVNYQTAQQVMDSQNLGGLAKAVQTFSDGTAFQAGYDVDTGAYDENGTLLGSYPNINVMYENGLFLDISKPMSGIGESSYPTVLSETYQGIAVRVSEMDYLFLPPDAEPSEADLKLQEEGKLEISYGSQEAERKVYRGAVWDEDGLHYHLLAMNGQFDAEDLMAKAKEIIDAK